MMSYDDELRVAVEALRAAAGFSGTVQLGAATLAAEKQDGTPVTVADLGSQALICRAIHKHFPRDAVVAEESGAVFLDPGNGALLTEVVNMLRRFEPEASVETLASWIDLGSASADGDRFWTLDPVDGTRGFLRGEHYAIALALLVGGEVQVAALACPNSGGVSTGTLSCAVRGQGAWSVALLPNAVPSALEVSAISDPALARYCESVESRHTSHRVSAAVAAELGIRGSPVRLDSQAKYAFVAGGNAEIYLRLPTRPGHREKIWDHAAGALIVREAKGTVSDINGKPLDFTRGRELSANRGVVVTNGLLHDRVLGAIRSVCREDF